MDTSSNSDSDDGEILGDRGRGGANDDDEDEETTVEVDDAEQDVGETMASPPPPKPDEHHALRPWQVSALPRGLRFAVIGCSRKSGSSHAACDLVAQLGFRNVRVVSSRFDRKTAVAWFGESNVAAPSDFNTPNVAADLVAGADALVIETSGIARDQLLRLCIDALSPRHRTRACTVFVCQNLDELPDDYRQSFDYYLVAWSRDPGAFDAATARLFGNIPNRLLSRKARDGICRAVGSARHRFLVLPVDLTANHRVLGPAAAAAAAAAGTASQPLAHHSARWSTPQPQSRFPGASRPSPHWRVEVDRSSSSSSGSGGGGGGGGGGGDTHDGEQRRRAVPPRLKFSAATAWRNQRHNRFLALPLVLIFRVAQFMAGTYAPAAVPLFRTCRLAHNHGNAYLAEMVGTHRTRRRFTIEGDPGDGDGGSIVLFGDRHYFPLSRASSTSSRPPSSSLSFSASTDACATVAERAVAPVAVKSRRAAAATATTWPRKL